MEPFCPNLLPTQGEGLQPEMDVKENQSSWPQSQKNKTKSASHSEEFTVNNDILKEVKYQENILFTDLAVKAPLASRSGFPPLI